MKNFELVKISAQINSISKTAQQICWTCATKNVYGQSLSIVVSTKQFVDYALTAISGQIQARWPRLYGHTKAIKTLLIVDLIIGLSINISITLNLLKDPTLITILFMVDLAMNNLIFVGAEQVAREDNLTNEERKRSGGYCKFFGALGKIAGSLTAILVYGSGHTVPLWVCGIIWGIERIADATASWLTLSMTRED